MTIELLALADLNQAFVETLAPKLARAFRDEVNAQEFAESFGAPGKLTGWPVPQRPSRDRGSLCRESAPRLELVDVPGYHNVLWDAFDETAAAIESFLA